MLRITLFGAPTGTGPENRDLKALVAQPKRIALLAYLVVEATGKFLPRDQLLEIFWPNYDHERARNSLRTALHAIREHVGPEILLRQGNDFVGLNRQRVASDVAAFRARIESGAFADGLALYKDRFLNGITLEGCSDFNEWVDRTRENQSALAGAAALRLAEDEFGRDNIVGAIFWTRRAEVFLPHNEELVVRLIVLLALAGNVAAALHEFTRLEQRLLDYLDVTPSEHALDIIDQIKTGHTPASHSTLALELRRPLAGLPSLPASAKQDVTRGGLHNMHYRDFVENADDVMYRADVFGYFTYANQAATRLLGLPLDQILGRLFVEFVREDFRSDAVNYYIRQVQENIESTYFEFPAVMSDGEAKWVGQRVQLVRSDGVVIGIQAVARDITATRRIERAQKSLGLEKSFSSLK